MRKPASFKLKKKARIQEETKCSCGISKYVNAQANGQVISEKERQRSILGRGWHRFLQITLRPLSRLPLKQRLKRNIAKWRVL